MSRRSALICGILLLSVAGAVVYLRKESAPEKIFEVSGQPPSLAPMCPWRDPDADLKILFPQASRFERETRVLSGLRTESSQRLGRAPTAEENALQVYRIFKGADCIGEVTTRRVKGAFGAIELVVGADSEGGTVGVLLQRLREPPRIAEALQSDSWRRQFHGKSATSLWNTQELLSCLPLEARASGEAVVDGVRSTSILLAISEQTVPQNLVQAHHH